MPDITDHGRKTIDALAAAHGLSHGAVEQMARALVRGGGTMAQFDIPELGGSGQWMAGGMTMVGDMFNSALKVRVESLCADLTRAMAEGQLFTPPKHVGGFNWWPEGMGQPSSIGGQNRVRYAYFPQAQRIAFDPGDGGPMVLFDTLDHRIGGFGQQQSGPGDPYFGISFSSQKGQFALASLPRAGETGEQPSVAPRSASSQSQSDRTPAAEAEPARMEAPAPTPASSERAPSQPGGTGATAQDPIELLEKLGKLHEAGVLTDEEFSRKKAEILSRI